MKKIIIVIILMCLCPILFSQRFSTKLYIEDKNGAKDTLEVGYDPNATNGVDPIFGEVSYSSPIDSTKFQAFIVVSDQGAPKFLKKQILKTYTGWVGMGAITIVFPYESSPVTINWDKSLFNDSERNYSLITDWPMGGWFDATGGWSPKLTYLKDTTSIQFTAANSNNELLAMKQYGYTFIKNEIQIPLRTVYLAFASKENILAGVNKVNTEKLIELYPNPVKNTMTIKSSDQNSIKPLKIISFDGKISNTINRDASEIDCSRLPKGIYFIAIECDKDIVYKKFIKE